MKARSTIRREMRHLRRIIDDPLRSDRDRSQAYGAEMALQWVTEKITWSLTADWRSPLKESP